MIATHCTAHDYDDPGKPSITWDDAAARAALVDALVSDAHRVLGRVPDQELGARAAEAVALLALIAGQDVEPVDDSDGTDGRWRIAERVAPYRVISTVDPEARHAHKTVHRRQDGFKAHIAVEPQTGIITDCTLTKASGPDTHDAAVAAQLLTDEATPVTVLGDSAYGSGDFRAHLAEAKHVDLSSPRPCAQRRRRFTIDHFIVDHTARTATRPAHSTRTITARFYATFGVACRAARWVRSAPLVPPQDPLDPHALRTPTRLPPTITLVNWLNEYRQHRPMVERTIAWLTAQRKVATAGHPQRSLAAPPRRCVNLRRLITLGLTHTGASWAIA